MFTSLIFLGVLFLNVGAEQRDSVDMHFKGNISVALIKQKWFVLSNEYRVLKSFDVSIIENFGRKFNLKVEFLTIHTSIDIILK